MTHPAISAAYSKRLRASTLMIAFVALFGYSGVVEGQGSPASNRYQQDSSGSIARKLMQAQANRSSRQVGRYGTESSLAEKLSLPPLPGEQGFADAAFNPEKLIDENGPFGGGLPDFGKNNRENVNLVLPALKGFQQLTTSAKMKEMFQNLVTAEVPVLFQTYMMVENGAATGYIGGLNAVSNVFSNTMQANDLQLKLMSLTDDTGKMKEAYIKDLRKSMKNQDSWPAALYAAAGDTVLQPGAAGQDQVPLNDQDPFDLEGLPSERGPGDRRERLLSDLLFLKEEVQGAASATGTFENRNLNELKEDFKKLLGDMKISLKPEPNSQSKSMRALTIDYVPPTMIGSGGSSSAKRRGLAAETYSEAAQIWEQLTTVLSQYCEFVNNNPNGNKEMFKSYTAATSPDIGKAQGNMTPWEAASAPDIAVTVNLINKFFMVVKAEVDGGQVNCQELKKDENDIPQDLNNGSGTDLDDCSNQKGCLRNRLILHVSYLLARSRAMHSYRTMYVIAKKFATDPELDRLLEDLFRRTLGGLNLDEEIQRNRGRWDEFSRYMGEVLQSKVGGGSAYKWGGNNLTESFAANNGGASRGGP